MNEEKKAEYTGKELPSRITLTSSLLKKASESSDGTLNQDDLSKEELEVLSGLAKKRGATDSPFKTYTRETVVYKLCGESDAVAAELKKVGVTGNEIGEITTKMLESGEWKKGTFRGYNISIPPARNIPGRINPYVSFLESVKDKLCSLGFQEFDGPLVETEFWNGDALFMPCRTLQI